MNQGAIERAPTAPTARRSCLPDEAARTPDITAEASSAAATSAAVSAAVSSHDNHGESSLPPAASDPATPSSSPVRVSAQGGGEASAAAAVAAALPDVESQVRALVASLGDAGEGPAGGEAPAAEMDVQQLWAVRGFLPLGRGGGGVRGRGRVADSWIILYSL